MLNDKSTLIAKAKAREAAEKLRAGADIEKVAKEYKLEVTSPAEFRSLRFGGKDWDNRST